jgi:hypothetical protein
VLLTIGRPLSLKGYPARAVLLARSTLSASPDPQGDPANTMVVATAALIAAGSRCDEPGLRCLAQARRALANDGDRCACVPECEVVDVTVVRYSLSRYTVHENTQNRTHWTESGLGHSENHPCLGVCRAFARIQTLKVCPIR